MDEPTNFLDLDSVDALIKAVNKFSGGLIVVTHNRDFLKRTVTTFLSIIPGAFLEFPTMKDAERATYSFITALESGEQVDFKQAIQDNRGGGSVMSEESLAIRAQRLTAQQKKAEEEFAAAEAERLKQEAIAAEKEAARLAKIAAQKTDWAAGEVCWANIKGKWVECEVVRNVPAMGVTVKVKSTGESSMLSATKLKAENPGPAVSAPSAGRGGARGGAAAGKSRGGAAAPVRGGAATGKARGGAAAAGGARGGAAAPAGGARGGRGGRGGAAR